MDVRKLGLGMGMVLATASACAAQGLAAPAVETLWPRWQARITVLATTPSPLAGSTLLDRGNTARGLQGGGVFGDYVFAAPTFGRFRASGGLISGNLSGLPLASGSVGTRLGVSVVGQAAPAYPSVADGPNTLPYLGLGFTSAAWRNGLALTAELGVVSERPAGATGLGRALFGNSGLDSALRDMRLAPVLQLGVRYSF